MKNELTEEESISIDLALKKYLDLHKKTNVFKSVLPFFLKQTGIEKNRIELLKNGGMTEKWLEKENKRVNIKLIKKTLKDFKITKYIAIGSFIIAITLAIMEIIQWKGK